MRSNTPHPFWKLEDFDFDMSLPDDKSAFAHWSRVLEFFEEYNKKFGLDEFIRYNTLVENIEPFDPSAHGNTHWLITVKNLSTQEVSTSEFDAMVIANGRDWYPYIPQDIPGLAEFNGRVMHFSDFDSAEDFSPDERVLVVGSSVSGMELVEVLHTRCQEVLWSHHTFFVNADNYETMFPTNVKHLSDIDCIKGYMVHFKPGAWNSPKTPEKVDTIILATGFEVNNLQKMVHPSVRLEQINKTFEPLHRQLIHMDFHTLCFPFQFSLTTASIMIVEHQIKYYVRWLLGKFEFPSRSEMEKIREREMDVIEKIMGTRDSKFLRYHFLLGDPNRVSNYLNALSDEAGMPRVSNIFQDNFNAYFEKHFKCPITFRTHDYEVDMDGRIKITEPPSE